MGAAESRCALCSGTDMRCRSPAVPSACSLDEAQRRGGDGIYLDDFFRESVRLNGQIALWPSSAAQPLETQAVGQQSPLSSLSLRHTSTISFPPPTHLSPRHLQLHHPRCLTIHHGLPMTRVVARPHPNSSSTITQHHVARRSRRTRNAGNARKWHTAIAAFSTVDHSVGANANCLAPRLPAAQLSTACPDFLLTARK